MELDARFGLLEQLRVLAHRAACTERVAPCRQGIQSRFDRHTLLPPLRQWPGRNDFSRLLLLRAGSPVLESRRGVYGPHRSQTARAARRWLGRGQCWPSVYRGEMHVVFLPILAVARIVIWTTRKKGLYDGANFSHRYLILFFRHRLRVKIRCDRKSLDRITFEKR